MRNKIIVIIVFILVVAFILYKCEGEKKQENKVTTTYKQGEFVFWKHTKGAVIATTQDSVRVDTVIKWRASKPVIKKVVQIVKDIEHHYHVSNDEFQIGAYTVSIKDTLKGDTIERITKLLHIDSTHFIIKKELRIDTVFLTKTDTVIINKGSYWKGLKHGFAAGTVVGLAGGVVIAK